DTSFRWIQDLFSVERNILRWWFRGKIDHVPKLAIVTIQGYLEMTHKYCTSCFQGEVEDEKSRKKREKMEKKASRGKMVKTRTR
uniref:Uncharacterized protein n=1 Tax=Aegilops tauschii subsp. strangulata TaxID=200361 RepID=A0A453P7Q0_AEGTS